MAPRKYKKHFERFQSYVGAWGASLVEAVHGSNAPMSDRDTRRYKVLLEGFTEITNSLDALRLSAKFVSASPPRIQKMGRDQYLRYHINAYLQEGYILRERLITYSKKITRLYKSTPDSKEIAKALDQLTPLVEKAFSNVVLTRGHHVHQLRYDDEELSWLSIVSLVAEHEPSQFKTALMASYKKNRKKWMKQMRNNDRALRKFLDTYFQRLCRAIAPTGKLDPP